LITIAYPRPSRVFGRVLVSVLGVLIAMLSATGLVIWARKRRVRALAAGPRATLTTSASTPLTRSEAST
jgi:uncharacterized iron-regulated membrane protein